MTRKGTPGTVTTEGRLSRRRFLELGGASLAGAALLGVAGCGGAQQTSGATEIVFTFGPDQGGGLRTLIDRFNREHEGEIRATWRETPAASDEYFEQVRGELQSGSSSIDVIGGDVIWPPQLAANGYILDLSDRFTGEVKERHLDGPVEATEFEGKTWAVPWFTDAGMFYYRQDLLDEAGFSEPPQTWDEMKEMVEKIRRDRGTRFGYVFQGAQDEGGVVDALEHIWNAGGDVLEGDRVVIDSPASREGLELRRSLIADGIAPRATADYSTQESQAVFTNGEVIFMRNWPFVYGLLADESTSRVRPEQVNIGLIPTTQPGRQSFSGLGGWNFMVNANSGDKIEEIWTFIEFMSSPESQKTLALQSTRLPTLKSLYEDREIREKVPVARLGREALQNTKPRPRSPYYSDMSLRMADQFNAALKGNISAEEALSNLRRELENIVRQAG